MRTQGSSFGDRVRKEAVWGISLKYLYIPFVARQGNSPAPQTVTNTTLSAFGTRFSAAVLSCMWGALCSSGRGCLEADSLESSLPKRNVLWPRWLGRAEVACTTDCSCGEGWQSIPPWDVAAAGRCHASAGATAKLTSPCCACCPAPCEHSPALPWSWDTPAPADAPQPRLGSLIWRNRFVFSWLKKK